MSLRRLGVRHPEAVLVYFDGRGEAEVIRLLLAATGTSFKEIHVTEEFPATLLNQDDSVLLRKLPILKVDGLTLMQTGPIVRHLARRAFMLGEKFKEAAKVQTVFEKSREMYRTFLQQEMTCDDDEAFVKQVRSKVIPEFLPKFNQVLENNTGGPYVMGVNITLADIGLLDVLFAILDYCDVEDLQPYYGLKLLLKTAREERSIQYYIKNLRRPLLKHLSPDDLYLKHLEAVSLKKKK